MSMESRAWIATRKGLFELRRKDGAWGLGRIGFLGEPVSMLLPPQASGRMLAALNLGHFGVKVHASDDAGASWRELPAPAYPPQPEGEPAGGVAWKLVQIWALEGAADGALWAGTLPGGQDPHRIARCAAQPDVLWCQHHGGIWRSTDNAQTWREITGAPGSTFGFAVAVHPDDADTAWFVPGVADQQRVPVGAALQVNRTRDGGRSF